MIKRINTLKRVGRFTELIFTVGGDGDFVKLNVIFAINTSGRRFHHAAAGEQADEPDTRELRTFVERTLSVIHN